MLDSSVKVFFSLRMGLVYMGLWLFAAAGVAQQPTKLPPELNNDPNPKPAHEHTASTKDVQEKLQKGLNNKNAAYAGSNIQSSVDDKTVTLNGTVTSEMQHEMALQLVRAYASNRSIVDRLVIQ